MYRSGSALVFSPSDLTLFMESPFASWMARFTVDCPQQAPEPDEVDAMQGLLQDKGGAHEQQVLQDLIAQGLRIADITDEAEPLAATRAAMQTGADVIFQAALAHPPFKGYADFLVRVPGASRLGDYHYEVWDTKLSSAAKPGFVMQLCCYADMLAQLQGVRPERVQLVLGRGDRQVLRIDDYFYYYRSLKAAFLAAQQQFDPGQRPDPADSTSWGRWQGCAEQLLLAQDHLSQVATITRAQIKKLQRAGIHTMQALADTTLTQVNGIHPALLERLKAQARIQKASAGLDQPLYEVVPHAPGVKQGLALLPPASPLDVFFDIEGYPLDEGGLEYLWGNTYFDETGRRCFKDFWAHDRAQEKTCFMAFIQWVYARWQQDPGMHIYHYANYEIAACRKLMSRYGVCEYEVDQLLRNEVFVDLYKVVKGALLLGEPRYSIKNVEHLYRGKRATEVGNGGDSVVVYEQWRERFAEGLEGDSWQASPILKSIRDYNIDDCDSTQELVDWLRKKQQAQGIAYLGKTAVEEPELTEEVTERTRLRDQLLARAEELAPQAPAQASLTENLAWMLEFHRREAKPVFWRLFDRLGLSEVELRDDLDCLADCRRTPREPFKPTPRARNLAYEFRFDPDQEFKAGSRDFYVLGELDDNGRELKARLLPEHSDLAQGLIVLTHKAALPDALTLVPDEYVPPNPIPEAIDAQVQRFAAGQLDRSAIIDFLERNPPRIEGLTPGEPLVTAEAPDQRLAQIIQRAQNLEHSCLIIQGPPGAGKTYTGKHIIAKLVRAGKKVGICSNSHKAINNLLIGAARYCRDEGIGGQFACTKDTDAALAELDVQVLNNGQLAAQVAPGCVLGTTAWGFARADMAGALDYLFIDEAGQVSVANLVAISRAADNLIVMGDQMQLGQPAQGTHPADSGLSVLDYYLHDTPTIPDTQGVFLGTTYRMHSAVNRFISDAIYEGKLQAHPANDRQIIAVPPGYSGPLDKTAGLVFVPVPHTGNTQASEEEAARLQALAAELLGRTVTDKQGHQYALNWQDMLFVAPYNHQVNKLREALAQLPGGAAARVGSVDKFQGQEAPVVLLSMCASDAGESPRGLEFLFDRHRINVAISRAQSLAVVVANPGLLNTSAQRVEQLAQINLFARLLAYAQQS